MSRESPLVVGLVGASHLVNHAYLVLLVPAYAALSSAFDVGLPALGLAVGLLSAVVTVLQLPLGYVSDTYSRRLVLGFSLALGSLGAFVAALAPTFEWLLAAQVVMGVGVAGHHPAHYPLLSAATAADQRGRAYSVHGFTGALGFAVPYALVPAVAAVGGSWREAFALLAALGAAVGVAATLLLRRVPREITRPPDPSPLPRPGGGDLATFPRRAADLAGRGASGLVSELRAMLSTPVILTLTSLWFANSVAAWGIKAYAPTLLQSYGYDPGTASLVGSVMLGVGAVVLLGGGVLADDVGPVPVMLAGYGVLVAVAAALAAGVPAQLAVGGVGLPLAVGLVAFLSATIDVSRPARSKLTDGVSAREDVGKNFALMTVGISAGGAVAPPVFGYVIARAGVAAAFYGVAAVAAVTFALTLAVRARTGGAAAAAGAPGD